MDAKSKSLLSRILSVAKYPAALAILAYVLQQADLERIGTLITQMPPHLLALAILSFAIAQAIATLRMNAYYAHANRPIHTRYSLKLHYVALFYNIILPGGIGGDGYKVYLLKNKADYPVKEGIAIQLLTRTNGLLVLLASIWLTLPFIELPISTPIRWSLSIAGLVASTVAYFWLMPRLLNASPAMERRALPYSVGVQGFNMLTMVILWLALSDGSHLAEYILLFQLAAIAGMIPLTIGGLGIREFTFFYGAQWLNHHTGSELDGELGILISLLVFAITALNALIGMVWLGRIRTINPCTGQPDSYATKQSE